MKITELIKNAKKTAFSFEVLPPLKGNGVGSLYATIDKLMEFEPAYINITTHRSEYVYSDAGGGMFTRKRLRKRPGTVAVAATIKNKYGVNVVPHILCSGFTKEETEYVLIDLQFLDIHDLLILRGDKAKHDDVFHPDTDGHAHAVGLIKQVNDFNNGIFIDGSPISDMGTPFSFGVASYPEKHNEAPNMESDIYWLKKKVELGAEYAVTQMFFDNDIHYNFLYRIREAGITVPVLPGIMPITSASQMKRSKELSGTVFPRRFLAILDRFGGSPSAMKQAGIAYATDQIIDLLANGVKNIHIYTMNRPDVAAAIMNNLSEIVKA